MSLFAKVLAFVLSTVIIFALFLWFISANDPVPAYVITSCFASLGIYSTISDTLFVLRWHNLGEEE